MVKVAVIGAGPSGVFSAGAIGDAADVTIFERASIMGGQWAFGEKDLVETDRTHSRYLLQIINFFYNLL